jgi:hypothetical protein
MVEVAQGLSILTAFLSGLNAACFITSATEGEWRSGAALGCLFSSFICMGVSIAVFA